MQKLQQKLDMLLEKYAVERQVTLCGFEYAEIDGVKVPLHPWRQERRFIEMRNNVINGTLGKLSVLRSSVISPKGTSLNKVLKREADVCRYLLGAEIVSVMEFAAKDTLNAVLKMDNDTICTIELAATLPEGARVVDKHEIATTRGSTCDKVVDTQTMQSSVYLLSDESAEYTDVDFELYGLSIDEIAVVRAAFAAAKQTEFDSSVEREEKLEHFMVCADRSAKNCERVDV